MAELITDFESTPEGNCPIWIGRMRWEAGREDVDLFVADGVD
jgi:hypothetical protein